MPPSSQKLSPLFVLATLLLLSCSPNHPKRQNQVAESGHSPGKITICGAYALAPFISSCAGQFVTGRPDVDISVIPMSHDSALQMMHDQRCQMAMISRPLKPDEEELFALPVAKCGVVLIFNEQNPLAGAIRTQGLTINDLQKIYSSGDQKNWDDFLNKKGDHVINPYFRADPSGAGEVLAHFLFLEPGEMKGGAVNGAYEMIRSVSQDPLGLGYCNVNEAFDLQTGNKLEGIDFVPVDLNMSGGIEEREQICTRLDDFLQSICINTYPHKLSRNLYMLSPEKPTDPILLEFLGFVITRGQEQLEPMGYTQLPASLVRYNQYLLK